ncbi:hypothetical protein H681_08065 [Pseudomonas sp. ATCC 13867]|nr:hypothetical protein H681_08065 [Pseudomonas sp. ATCC 13867]RFQ42249.1 hypothetical protein D0N87_00440 [Pseudomonas sp. ATCC 13867]
MVRESLSLLSRPESLFPARLCVQTQNRRKDRSQWRLERVSMTVRAMGRHKWWLNEGEAGIQ